MDQEVTILMNDLAADLSPTSTRASKGVRSPQVKMT
jgi:hypothetical protein